MVEEKEKVRKMPLSRVKSALKTIDREPRGADEEYRKTVIREYDDLNVFSLIGAGNAKPGHSSETIDRDLYDGKLP